MIQIDETSFATLSICAIRYCQGRQTYMPSLVLGIVREYLHELSDKDIQVMLNDCDYQEECNLYGSEVIDKPGWMDWRKALEDERLRRQNQTGN